ncbi:MAG: MBL fold metallo-hydrolase [bacterium]|nr:MBL fold metallo-hydrolase [bacterium]
MEEEIKINAQSSIRLTDQETVIYLDPYLIDEEVNDADYIFITHDHYDHLSIEDINKVIKESTIIIISESCSKSLEEFNNQIVKVKPNNKYLVGNLNFQTVASYNTNKLYHPEKNEWVGYLIDFNNKRYFITGDTDINKENKQIKCDVLLLPVGGVYTMDYNEAATLTNLIKPKLAIPTHYQTVVGTKIDAINYTNLLDKDIESKILY